MRRAAGVAHILVTGETAEQQSSVLIAAASERVKPAGSVNLSFSSNPLKANKSARDPAACNIRTSQSGLAGKGFHTLGEHRSPGSGEPDHPAIVPL
jgi:hypothetical protein